LERRRGESKVRVSQIRRGRDEEGERKGKPKERKKERTEKRKK